MGGGEVWFISRHGIYTTYETRDVASLAEGHVQTDIETGGR